MLLMVRGLALLTCCGARAVSSDVLGARESPQHCGAMHSCVEGYYLNQRDMECNSLNSLMRARGSLCTL
jgi:hypothetical protein